MNANVVPSKFIDVLMTSNLPINPDQQNEDEPSRTNEDNKIPSLKIIHLQSNFDKFTKLK